MNASPQTVAQRFRQTAQTHALLPFVQVLRRTAAAYGIDPVVLDYQTVQRDVEALSRSYADAGYGIGQRVGLLVENRPAFFVHWFALNALGISVVPINPDLRSAELEYLIGHSELVAVVAVEPRHSGLRQAAAGAARDVVIFSPHEPPPAVPHSGVAGTPNVHTECALLYTSGTTGRPKGCVLTNEYFLQAGIWYATIGGLIALTEGSERMLTPLPLFHMNAMAYSTMAMVQTGGCLIVLDRFHPRSWWEDVREASATIVHYLGVMPPMLMAAEASDDDRSHGVRFGFGAGVDRGLHAPFEERFGFPLVEAWAMTETGAGGVVVASREPRHVGSSCFGVPEPGLAVRVVLADGTDAPLETPGELLVRAAGADPRRGFFRCYLKDDTATDAAWQGGWFHTGDVVRQGADGALYFVDRKKNVIRRSGENISAVEVESVLMRHPAVRQVAVAAAPDAVRGDEVFACVVPHAPLKSPDASAALAGEIVQWCLERLAYYKAPGYVAFVDAVPLTTTQKIQRGELKALVDRALSGAMCVDTRALKKRVAA